MKIEQLVWVGDSYEIASDRNSERPDWPVQAENGQWKYQQFEGQRVVYDRAKVYFGFQAVEVQEADLERDEDGEVVTEGIVFADSRVFKEVK